MLFPRNGIDRKSPQLVTRTVISCKVKKLAKCSANGTGISTVIASKSALSCEHYRGFFSIGPANFFSISFDSTFFSILRNGKSLWFLNLLFVTLLYKRRAASTVMKCLGNP